MAIGKLSTILATATLLSPLAVQAQDMSADEILALLQAQREQLAEANDGLGVARTLEFVTESTPQTDPASGVALATQVPGDALAASTDGGVIPEDMVIDLTIFFEFDSALLKPESKSQVDALCTAIQQTEEANAAMEAGAGAQSPVVVPHGVYQIIGHTDASGSVGYNLSLSQARADEVVRYMVRECGIDGTILQAVGMGEARLKDPSDPRADANRRVEIQVVL